MKFLDISLKNILPHKMQLNDGTHLWDIVYEKLYIRSRAIIKIHARATKS